MIKPDKEIYNVLLKRYDIKAGEFLFIDDNMTNAVTAKEMGFSTIHLKDGIYLEEELIKMGFLWINGISIKWFVLLRILSNFAQHIE